MSTLGEHQGNGIRFDMHLSAPNGGVAQMLCRPEGQWVSWNEYEKLKAEVNYWRIEAETDHARWLRVLEDVERLRKAGDAMALSLANADRMEYGDPSEPIEGYMNREVIKAWNAAKEGKQP